MLQSDGRLTWGSVTAFNASYRSSDRRYHRQTGCRQRVWCKAAAGRLIPISPPGARRGRPDVPIDHWNGATNGVGHVPPIAFCDGGDDSSQKWGKHEQAIFRLACKSNTFLLDDEDGDPAFWMQLAERT
jgi:hypothetical protein